MKIKKYIFAFALCMGSLTSCVDLDIPPMNIVGDNDIFGNTAGVTSYMARLYSTLPVEDFRYSHTNMFFSGGSNFAQPSCITGEAISRDTKGSEVEKANYWDAAYALIRETNYFIETLPKYASSHSATEVESLLGEAYFIRAYTYFALAKRYGGVPIVSIVIDYPATVHNCSVIRKRLSGILFPVIWTMLLRICLSRIKKDVPINMQLQLLNHVLCFMPEVLPNIMM